MKIALLGLLAVNYAIILYRLIRELIWVKERERELKKLLEEANEDK